MAYEDTKIDDDPGADGELTASEYNNLIGHTHRDVIPVSANHNANESDIVLVTGSKTVTLPGSHDNGDMITVKNVSTGVVTITSVDNIDGESDDLLLNYQFESVTVISDGTNWFLI